MMKEIRVIPGNRSIDAYRVDEKTTITTKFVEVADAQADKLLGLEMNGKKVFEARGKSSDKEDSGKNPKSQEEH